MLYDRNVAALSSQPIYTEYYGIGMPFVFSFAYGFWMLYGGSRMFEFMRLKQSAITYLMHPATNLEKYVARLAYVSFLWAAIGGMGLLIGDFLRWGVDLMFGLNTPMAIVHVWHDFVTPVLQDRVSLKSLAETLAASFTLCLWMYTFFVLGSAVFRRHCLLFTSFCFLFVGYAGVRSWHFWCFADSMGNFVAVLLLLAILNIIVAYHIFTRMQVISNKWLNI